MITQILFENLWLLLGVWVPVQFTLIALWSWLRSTTTKRFVWSGFAALPILMTISMMAVTDREKIVEHLNALALAVEHANIDEIALHFAEDFEARGYDREGMLKRIDTRLAQYPASHVRISQVKISFDGDEATVEFRGSANIQAPEIPYQYGTALWHSKWRRTKNSWLMTSLERQ